MATASLKSRYKELVDTLNHHIVLYYEKNKPEISDAEYDAMYKKLVELEESHPELIIPDSPTQKVGHVASTNFKKVKHTYRMYSLDNVFNTTELKKFYHRFTALRKDAPTDDVYYVDCKMDGLAIDLQYVDGIIAKAITRGNGIEGDDVTDNAMTIANIPKRIRTSATTFVRGEIVVHRTDFYAVNREREAAGLKTFSNTRNYAAGSLKQIDPKITAERHLRFYAWELIVVGKRRMCIDEQMTTCIKLGFNVPKGAVANSLEEIIGAINDIARERSKLPYDIDGAVVKHNHPDFQKVLGFNNHGPLWATAWKFSPDGAETTIETIEWRIGRTGVLTPVAHIKPVTINGVVVSAVTLDNASTVHSKQIGIGAKVRVVRSGDVIPKIVEIEKPGKFEGVPAKCPYCGGAVVVEGADARCTNRDCKDRFKAQLRYIFGKDLFDVKGVGKEFIRAAVDSGTITSLRDIFLPLESKDPKNVSQELLDTMVTRARDVNFMELLMLIGIDGLGRAAAGKLAMEAEDIDGLLNLMQHPEIMQQLPIFNAIKQNTLEWYKVEGNADFLVYIRNLKLPSLD